MTEAADRRRVMRWMGTWIDKVGSASGWLSLVALVPPLLLVLIGMYDGDFPYSLCPSSPLDNLGRDPDCVDDVNAWFIPVAIVVGLAFVAAWPLGVTWLSIRLHARRRHRLQGRFEPRWQMAKDWLMRGDIDEGQFERITEPLQQITDGDAPSERQLLAGQILARFGALLLAAGVGLAAIALPYASPGNTHQELWWYYGLLVPGSAFGIGIGTLLLVAGLPLRIRGVRGTAKLVAQAEAAEDAALAQKHGGAGETVYQYSTRPERPP